jgi:phosphoglucosamine mutase
MVGDIYVSEELKRGGQFGGEPSGAWVFPSVSLCPDGIYAAAEIASIASQQRLSALADGIPEYPIFRSSIGADGIAVAALEKRLTAMGPQSVCNVDGIKLDFKDAWVLVRPSGTEPKIRITAEAKSEARLRHLYERTLAIIKACAEAK